MPVARRLQQASLPASRKGRSAAAQAGAPWRALVGNNLCPRACKEVGPGDQGGQQRGVVHRGRVVADGQQAQRAGAGRHRRQQRALALDAEAVKQLQRYLCDAGDQRQRRDAAEGAPRRLRDVIQLIQRVHGLRAERRRGEGECHRPRSGGAAACGARRRSRGAPPRAPLAASKAGNRFSAAVWRGAAARAPGGGAVTSLAGKELLPCPLSQFSPRDRSVKTARVRLERQLRVRACSARARVHWPAQLSSAQPRRRRPAATTIDHQRRAVARRCHSRVLCTVQFVADFGCQRAVLLR